MTDNPVLIAGGGIGGLSAALGLAQKGFGVVVLEKSSKLGEIGAGIQLGPNAFHAFDYLGVGDAARVGSELNARAQACAHAPRHGPGGRASAPRSGPTAMRR